MLDRISKISEIKLHYARETQYPYGSRGRPLEFEVERSFNRNLKKCFDEMFEECPLGKPEIITCAGIYHPQHRNPNSHHKEGRAFDFDAAFWHNYTLITNKFHHNKALYLGMECFLRIHFGIVLNYNYPNHKDHWHFDDSVRVDFRPSSKSSILFLQMVLTYIYDSPVVIDGLWGPQTDGAIKETLTRIGLSGRITTITTYKAFLRRTGKIAYRIFEHKNSPITLLNNVYETVEHMEIDMASKFLITEALNDFRNHTQTKSWLKKTEVEVDLDGIIEEINV